MQPSVVHSHKELARGVSRKLSNRPAQSDDPRMDARLTALVKEALIAAGASTAKNILIETANGIVCLSGPVDSEAMRQATLAAARSVCGVPSVIDRLFSRDAYISRR